LRYHPRVIGLDTRTNFVLENSSRRRLPTPDELREAMQWLELLADQIEDGTGDKAVLTS
jgi:hypothetical protein